MAFDNELEEEENFAEMFAESEKKQEKSRIVEGELVEIQADENRGLVGVGDKLEGILNLDEITIDGKLKFNVGDKINVMITGYYNERPKISYKKVLEQQKTIDFINANKDNFEELVIEGKIVSKNRGGYVIEENDVAFFMPRSLATLKDTDDVVGRRVKAQVIKIDPDQNSIIVSRRKLFNEDRKKKKEIIDKIMENNSIIEGVIKKITSYGMFVDIGGVDGLVHYNEISYKGPVNPSKLYNEGDIIAVKAISYNKDKRHLSLSIKAVHPDPWEEIENELDEGDTITVLVSNIESYGAFVDLRNDVEGFLHISEISWNKNAKDPNDYLTIGDEIDVEVIEINSVTKKLRVSLKSLLPKPFNEFSKNYHEGDIVTGTITSLTDFGAFVKIGDVEGLLHNQDLSWEQGIKCKKTLVSGEEIEVKIININKEDQKISLSKKVLLESPMNEFAKENKVNSIVTGKVKDIKDFGIFISLADNIDALIRYDDLFPITKEELEIGSDIEAVIVVIDTKRNKIRLSVKKLDYLKNQTLLNEINDTDSHSLGDIIKDQLSK